MDIGVETRGLDTLARGFQRAERDRPKILTRAINRTLTKARTLTSKAVREDLALPAAYVRDRLSIRKANYNTLRGELTGRGRPILWARFKYRATRKGVSARINKREGRRTARGGFVVPMRAGGKRMAAPVVRMPGRYRNTGSGRFKPLYAPSVAEVMTEKRAKVEPEIANYLATQVDNQVDKLMEKI